MERTAFFTRSRLAPVKLQFSVARLDKVLRTTNGGLSWKRIFFRHVSSLSAMFSLEFDLSGKREKLGLSGYQSDCYTMLQRNTCDLMLHLAAIFSTWALRPRFHATSGDRLNLCIKT